MPEDPTKVTPDARAEAAPKQEQQEKSLDYMRDMLTERAEDSVEGLEKVLKILEGSDQSAEAAKIRAQAGSKLEELKNYFRIILEDRKTGGSSAEEPEPEPEEALEEIPAENITPEEESSKEATVELPEISASIEDLRALLNQLEEAYRTPSGKDFSMRAAALNRAAEVLENDAYAGVVLRRDKDGGPLDDESMNKAALEAQAQLRKKEQQAKEVEKPEEESPETSAEAEKIAERIKQLEDLRREIDEALNYFDGGKETVAKGPNWIKDLLVRAGDLLNETEEVDNLIKNNRAGTAEYRKALEELFKKAQEEVIKLKNREGEGGSGEGEGGTGEGEGGTGEGEGGTGEGEGGTGEGEGGTGDGEGPGGVPEQPGTPEGQETVPTPFEQSVQDYAAAKAEVFKGFGGILGRVRRLINQSGYGEAQARLEAARAAYEKERNALVLENVNNFVSAELALADQTKDRMAETKRLKGFSWAYDKWKKLGKARLGGALALAGVGLGLSWIGVGGLAVAGGMFVGKKVLTLGGLTTGFGAYEGMTQASYHGILGKGGEAPKIPLSEARNRELEEWDEQYKNANQVPGKARLLLAALPGGGLSEEQQQAYSIYMARRRALESRLNEEELAAGGVETLSDQKLDEALAYYGAEMPFRGIQPANDPTYVAFLREKARRMRGALEVSDQEGQAGVQAATETRDREIEAVKNEKVQEKVNDVKTYLKQWYLTEYRLFESMKNVAVEGTTKEERQAARKQTPEYSEWLAATASMKEQFEALPEDVQAILLRAEGDQRGRRTGLRELLAADTAESLYQESYSDVQPDNVWEADWQLNPDVQAELERLLRGNEALMQEAVEEAQERMQVFVTEVENQERAREARRDAVMASITTMLNEHDGRVEDMTKTAVRKDAYRKLIAAALAAASVSLAYLAPSPFDPENQPGPKPGPAPEPGPEPTPEPTPGPEPTPEPGPAPEPDGGGEPWTPEEDGFSPWEPEPKPAPVPPVEPGPVVPEGVGESLDATFKPGNGVIHLARRLAKVNPQLFEGMSDSEMQRTVLRKLMDTKLPDGRPALLWDAEKGWGYNFTARPGDTLTFNVDADGHFTGVDPEGFRPRAVTNWRPFGGVKIEDVMPEPTEPIAPEVGEAAAAPEVGEAAVAPEGPVARPELRVPGGDEGLSPEAGEAAAGVAERAAETSGPVSFESDHIVGGRVDVTVEGGKTRILVDGNIIGVGPRQLIDEGVLQEDYVQKVTEAAGGERSRSLGLWRSIAENNARDLYLKQEALRSLESAGQTEKAEILRRAIADQKVRVEEKYGDIFK